jgi:hypothetical protein
LVLPRHNCLYFFGLNEPEKGKAMNTLFRKSLCFTLALVLVSTPIIHAQQTSPSTPATTAPIPSQIAAAHTVFLSNGGGPNYYNIFSGGTDRGYNTFYAAIQRWNRYQFVDSPSQADLIFEIRSIAPAVDVSAPHGTGSVAYNPELILRILDPRTNAILWTTTANVVAFGRQKTRDREFDQSVGVLVDKLAQLTGEQLNAAQLKAIQSNSKTSSTAAKVLFGVGIAAGAGILALGLYSITHRNQPTLPTVPSCTNPAFCSAVPVI